jgi:hypothetical protein
VAVDERQMAEVRQLLADVPNGLPRVITRALNKVSRAARAQIVRVVAQEINLKAGEVRDRNTSLDLANYSRLLAEVYISGRRIPIRHFGAEETATGVAFAVRRGARQEIPGAFLATMDNSHVGVFARRHVHIRASRSQKARAQYPGSLPMVEQYGPSVPELVDGINELTQQVMEEKLGQDLDREIGTQVDLALTGRGGFGGDDNG